MLLPALYSKRWIFIFKNVRANRSTWLNADGVWRIPYYVCKPYCWFEYSNDARSFWTALLLSITSAKIETRTCFFLPYWEKQKELQSCDWGFVMPFNNYHGSWAPKVIATISVKATIWETVCFAFTTLNRLIFNGILIHR